MRRPPPILRDEALADDVPQGIGEALADELLLVLGEEAEDAVDGLAGIDGVQGGVDDVAGLGGGEGDLHGLAVADFADEDDLGRLAQGGAQAGGELREIAAELALGEGGLLRAGA